MFPLFFVCGIASLPTTAEFEQAAKPIWLVGGGQDVADLQAVPAAGRSNHTSSSAVYTSTVGKGAADDTGLRLVQERGGDSGRPIHLNQASVRADYSASRRRKDPFSVSLSIFHSIPCIFFKNIYNIKNGAAPPLPRCLAGTVGGISARSA